MRKTIPVLSGSWGDGTIVQGKKRTQRKIKLEGGNRTLGDNLKNCFFGFDNENTFSRESKREENILILLK